MTDIFDTSYEEVNIEISKNRVSKGDDVNLMAKDPALKKVLIAAGWDLNAFDSDPLDLDMSCFMLNKEGKTRVNEDFVFYNNDQSAEGGVVHNGDSRTGAGDGDDESILVDFENVPFDIMRIIFVLSVYQGDEKGHYLSKIRNCYLRVVNNDNAQEIVRYELDDDFEDKNETAMIVASLNREGPKWHFQVIGDFVEGGLGKVATEYDIIVQGG